MWDIESINLDVPLFWLYFWVGVSSVSWLCYPDQSSLTAPMVDGSQGNLFTWNSTEQTMKRIDVIWSNNQCSSMLVKKEPG